MCIYTGCWQNTEIKFFADNVFYENGQIIVKNPIGADDTNDRFVPQKIALSIIQMEDEKKREIISQVERERNKKIAAKAKRPKKI